VEVAPQAALTYRVLRYPEILRKSLAILIAFACALWPQQGPPPLVAPGVSMDGWELTHTDGKPVDAPGLVEDGPALLIVLPSSLTKETLCLIQRRLAAYSGFGFSRGRLVLPADSTPPPCSGEDADALWLRSPHLLATTKSDELLAVIVDAPTSVRWTTRISQTDEGWRELEEGLRLWVQGRQVYEVNCGHCHGYDGAQKSAPEVKTLVGITKKYPEPKVLELGSLFGGVDMTGWNAAKREALLLYLRGL